MDEQRCAFERAKTTKHTKKLQEVSSPICQILALKQAARMQRRKADCSEQLPSWQQTSELTEKHRKKEKNRHLAETQPAN